MKLSSYPKVFNLGHKAIEDLLKDDVIVQEKVDGSQFSWCKTADGILHFKSHHKEVYDGDSSMFDEALVSVKAVADKPKPGWIYRGEYLRIPHHNVLTYGRIPANHIIIFDITIGLEEYLPYYEVEKEAKRLGFEVVPIFFQGKITDFEQLKELLETESCLGGTKIEGVVIKNYYRFGRDKHCLMGKWVKEEMKEKISKGGETKSHKDILTVLGVKYRTEARWFKAIQHLREQGLLVDEPKDIGILIKEINNDVLVEEQEEIKEAVFKWAWKSISRIITAGFPEFYKEFLAKRQFAEKQQHCQHGKQAWEHPGCFGGTTNE